MSDKEPLTKDQNGDNKSQPISIKICQVGLPNVPTLSEENLIDEDEDQRPQGLVNPSFSFETASDGSSTPRKTPAIFTFDSNAIELYRRKKRSGSCTIEGTDTPSRTQVVALPRRGSYSPGYLSGEGVDQLRVPRLSELRRPSDPTLTVKDTKPTAQLTPIKSSIDNFSYNLSENKFPPPSPGFFGNGRGPFFDHPPPSPGLLSTNSAWSELAKLHSRRSSYGDFSEGRCNSNSLSNVSSSLSQYLHDLVRAFSSRTEKIKESTVQPPTPSSDSEIDAFSDVNSAFSALDEPPQRQHRIDSFIPSHLKDNESVVSEKELEQYYFCWGCCKTPLPACCKNIKFPSILEPQSKIYMSWLALVTLCFMYNAWAIPLRAVFPYQTPDNLSYWLTCDYICDLIYILDILVFKPRLTYLESGLMETDTKLTRKNYMRKIMFKFDLLSLMPLDLLYIAVGRVDPLLRLPRVLKIQTFWEFYERCDQAVRSAHILRIIKTMTYMLLLIHVETCLYYAISLYEGINSNRWVYNGRGNAYIRCFYLATKTATSIGNNPQPTNTLEYVFMTVYWLSGVFVFALLIGQIRDIADAAGRVKSLYNKRMDAAIWYVKNLNLPKETQDKVKTWFIYNWQQQKILDERDLMDTLPKNLRTDLAIHVHFNTLSKVKMFQDCDKTLLFDLVLKLKAILYLPGDYVCRKGEVGKEMYIVSQGQVEVVGGPDNSLVLATLKEGSVFGEISLLALGGEGNRRTADVRCKGFVNLFILSKGDFEAAMSDYPEANKHMKKQAKRLLRQNAKLKRESNESQEISDVEEIIKSDAHSETPRMVRTVIQVLDPGSEVGKKLVRSSHDSTVTSESKNLKIHIQKATDHDQHISALPTDQEVEDFYEEMLTVEYADDDVMEMEGRVEALGQGNTDSPGQSDESADSGVQLVKAISPTNSTSKTISNKDSKDSIISAEIMDSIEETRSWIMKQPLTEVETSKAHRKLLEEIFDGNIINTDRKTQYQGTLVNSNNQNTINSELVAKTFPRPRSVLRSDNGDSDSNEEIVMHPVKSARNSNAMRPRKNKVSPIKDIQMNAAPLPNQVTCSVEVHREKSLTPGPVEISKEKSFTLAPVDVQKEKCVTLDPEGVSQDKNLVPNPLSDKGDKDLTQSSVGVSHDKSLPLSPVNVTRDKNTSQDLREVTNDKSSVTSHVELKIDKGITPVPPEVTEKKNMSHNPLDTKSETSETRGPLETDKSTANTHLKDQREKITNTNTEDINKEKTTAPSTAEMQREKRSVSKETRKDSKTIPTIVNFPKENGLTPGHIDIQREGTLVKDNQETHTEKVTGTTKSDIRTDSKANLHSNHVQTEQTGKSAEIRRTSNSSTEVTKERKDKGGNNTAKNRKESLASIQQNKKLFESSV